MSDIKIIKELFGRPSKKVRWVHFQREDGSITEWPECVCGNCNEFAPHLPNHDEEANFCPYCGAEME